VSQVLRQLYLPELITLAIAQVFLGLPNDRKFLALAPTCSRRRAAERRLSPGVRTSEGRGCSAVQDLLWTL
jgi:hypothetical protein